MPLNILSGLKILKMDETNSPNNYHEDLLLALHAEDLRDIEMEKINDQLLEEYFKQIEFSYE
jgi:hypothetical protein